MGGMRSSTAFVGVIVVGSLTSVIFFFFFVSMGACRIPSSYLGKLDVDLAYFRFYRFQRSSVCLYFAFTDLRAFQ